MAIKIDSNDTGLALAQEASLKVLPGGTPGSAAIWQRREPNTYADWGGTVSTVTRETINATRQIQKGTVTGIEAKGGYNEDLTQNNMVDILPSFFYAAPYPLPSAFGDGSDDELNITDDTHVNLPDSFPDDFAMPAGALFATSGFVNPVNNGLRYAAAATAYGEDIALTPATMVPEIGSSIAKITYVGFQALATGIALTVAGALTLLTLSAGMIAAGWDWTLQPVQVGQWIFVGGDIAATQFALNKPFYARVAAITPTVLSLDYTSITPVADPAGGKTIQVFFSTFLTNAVQPYQLVRTTYSIERTLGLDTSGYAQAEYLVGSVPNEFTINIPQKAKVACDLSFVALDNKFCGKTLYNAEIAAGIASTAWPLISANGSYQNAFGETPFNTSADLFLMRLAPVNPATLNPTSLFQYATDAKLTINNGVTADDALAVVGAIEASTSDFKVTGTATVYFNDVNAVAQVRKNADCCFQSIFAKKNAGIVFDIPLITLGGGTNKVAKGKAVMLDLTTAGAQNPNGYTMSTTWFTYLPNVAMPSS